MSAVKILIAGDHELARKDLVGILNRRHPEWTVAAEASSGREAIERGESLRPDVAILDLSMPDVDGLRVAERLSTSVPGIRILVLTMHAAGPILRQLKETDVHGYLVRNEAPEMLVTAVERILAGERFFSSRSPAQPMETIQSPEYVHPPFRLTHEEFEAMRLLAAGQSDKELAAALDISVRTAETYRASIFAKLGIHSIGDLARIAIRHGVI